MHQLADGGSALEAGTAALDAPAYAYDRDTTVLLDLADLIDRVDSPLLKASYDIATGAALYKKVNLKPGIVIANIGDASMGCGPTWEAMNFAAMGQFHTLWNGQRRGGLRREIAFLHLAHIGDAGRKGDRQLLNRGCTRLGVWNRRHGDGAHVWGEFIAPLQGLGHQIEGTDEAGRE